MDRGPDKRESTVLCCHRALVTVDRSPGVQYLTGQSLHPSQDVIACFNSVTKGFSLARLL